MGLPVLLRADCASYVRSEEQHPGFVARAAGTHAGAGKEYCHDQYFRFGGERLACLAMDKVYGQFTGAYESPRLHEARVMKRNLEVTLEGNFNTLHSTTKEVTGLTVVDGTGKQVTVNARLKGKSLQIPLRGLKAPYQVYYCFDEATIGSLRTDAGMPVLPFRTEKIEVK